MFRPGPDYRTNMLFLLATLNFFFQNRSDAIVSMGKATHKRTKAP